MKLLLVELCVFVNWLALILFAALRPVLGLGDLSFSGFMLALVLNIPIAICYGMFVISYKPPLGKHLLKLANA